ncbi:MAG: galactonate dehydratase [Bacillota bacterium]
MVVIQKAGGSLKAIEKGTRLARMLVDKINMIERQPISVSNLKIGLKCGGTDATSGIAANPVLGYVSDRIINEGSTSIFTEITEILGAEHILVRRAASKEVADDIMFVVNRWEEILRRDGQDKRFEKRGALIGVGNMDGGVSTVVEKALGNILKSGSQKINGVLKYSQRPKSSGLYLMDSHGHDGEAVTGMVSCGAQIVLFTTGRGTPIGFPTAPVIKVTGNTQTFELMNDNMDFNAGGVVDGNKTIEECGELLLQQVLDVASGARTKAEIMGHNELLVVSRDNPRQ